MSTHPSCSEVLNGYAGFLRNQFDVSEMDDGCLVVTPFLNSEMAPVEIFIQADGGTLRLSDEGETLNQLFVNGVEVEANRDYMQQARLTAELNGVQFHHSEFFVMASPETIEESLQRLIGAVQSVSHLILKRSTRSRLRFVDEVGHELLANQISFRGKYEILGASRTHNIPIVINSDRNLLVHPVSATSVGSARDKSAIVAFHWLDIQKLAEDKYRYATVIDDTDARHRAVWEDADALRPLEQYSTAVLRWSTDQSMLIDMARSPAQ